MYNDRYLMNSCIIAEKRKERPSINETSDTCPFCLGHEQYIEHVRMEVKDPNEDFLVKIINNKYPICSEDDLPYGVHDVVIDTPRHVEHPKDFSKEHWETLLITMQKRWYEIALDPKIEFIQIFKNYGKDAGASIRHSHWQIVALNQIPYPVQLQYDHYNSYHHNHHLCYICDMVNKMQEDHIILENDSWMAIAPPVSQFSHETWLIPKHHRKQYGDLIQEELQSCSILLKKLLRGYNNLKEEGAFNICFMSGGIRDTHNYHFYIKIIPRLSHWAGFELATGCYINTVHPKTHVQLMHTILKE
jgi:UDPglucose--hexose-1-phosphate uridylyltransferase